MRLDPRARGVVPAILAILALCALAGLLAGPVLARTRGPLAQARSLARDERYADAERVYLELARQRPVSVPVLVEMLDTHAARLREASAPDDAPDTDAPPSPSSGPPPTPGLAPLPGQAPPSGPAPSLEALEAPVDAVLAAPDLPPGDALLARWWRDVLRHQSRVADHAAVLAAADADPPMPWADHLLGRADTREGEDARAAERFAREATAFDDRRRDADTACEHWIDEGDWERLASALEQPRFAHQVGADVRLQEALQRRDWKMATRWFFPSQYEGATPAILSLAAISASCGSASVRSSARCGSARGFALPSTCWPSRWASRAPT